MPITDIGSYPITMQEFVEHWIDVNAFLGGSPATDLKIKGGYTLSNFTADRTALDTLITFVATDNTVTLAADNRDIKKQAIRVRLSQFRGGVESQLDGTAYEMSLPTLPNFTDKESDYLGPFDDMSNLWDKINGDLTIPGFTPPLLLAAGYNASAFVAELAALRAAYLALGAAEDNLQLSRADRDKQMRAAITRMGQYRAACVAQLAPDNPLLDTLPELWPGGNAVVAVTLGGSWNNLSLKADLFWTPSSDSALGHYSVRTSPPPVYDDMSETIVADVLPGTTTLATDAGLLNPGDTALFKVYVVRSTGAEKGSNVISMTRP